MAKRKYTKKSDYWSKFDQDKGHGVKSIEDFFKSDAGQTEPQSAGQPYYTEAGSTPYTRKTGEGTRTLGRRNAISSKDKDKRYANIRGGMLPYEYGSDGINIRDTIDLCQKAYANIAIFKNAIDIMSELTNSELKLEGGSEKARNFIYKWFEKVNLWSLKDQYFREYYKTGNIFLYRIDGKFSTKDFAKLTKVYGEAGKLKANHIPIKYVLLNPYDVAMDTKTSFSTANYKKLLSKYDLEKLRNPSTEEDKAIFDALPKKKRGEIKKGTFLDVGIHIDLEPEKLSYSFYKKQDYEPFAVPFGYPVLDDINWKLELKKIDQAVSRTIENVILLITMGAEPDKGGINASNLQAMQALFQNESVGRVLVSDYTTDAEFIIPDISKIIGPDKYEIVNNDIREGLQNVVVGNEKFANTQVKAQIFLERLKEARHAFIHDFIQPQIKLVCRNLGFRKFPAARFEELDIKDEVQLQRVATRLIEIGILTPEQGVDVIKTGIYPDPIDLAPSQELYAEQREKGYWNPLVGGVPAVEAPGAQEERDIKEKAIDSKPAPTAPAKNPSAQKKTPNQNGRPPGTTGPQAAKASYSRKNIQETVYKIESLRTHASKGIKKRFSVKRLNKQQNQMLDTFVEAVICSKEKEDWESSVDTCIKNAEELEKLSSIKEVLDISASHELEHYPSAILYHSSE